MPPYNYIGIIGRNGSGKSTICDYLEQKGYHVYSLSDIVRQEATKKGLPHTREYLTETGNRLKKEDPSILAKMTFQKLKENEMAVFDSIRHPKEVEFLKEKKTYMISIEAPIEIRYERIKSRQKSTDFIDLETFKQQCETESKGKSSGQNIEEAMKLSDFHIENDGNISEFYQKVDILITKLTKE